VNAGTSRPSQQIDLSSFSKLLERQHKLVVEHLSIGHPLSNSQWGFFEGQPTATALLHESSLLLTTGFSESKRRRSVQVSLILFYSVPCKLLVTKLHQVGVPDHVLLWISGYLTCRSQRVVVNGATLQSMPLLSGVFKGQSLALSSSSYPSITLLLFQPLVIPKLPFMQMTFFLLFYPITQQDFSTYNLILCHEYYIHIHTVYQIQCTVD